MRFWRVAWHRSMLRQYQPLSYDNSCGYIPTRAAASGARAEAAAAGVAAAAGAQEGGAVQSCTRTGHHIAHT
eukprot:2208041-Rhodomonas_salina.3